MRFLILTGSILLVAPSVAMAQKKPDPEEVATLTKQIADLEALVARKQKEVAKAKTVAEEYSAEHKRVNEAEQKRLKEAKEAQDKALVAPAARAVAAKLAAARATERESDASRALDEAKEKLKEATDPKETAEWKEKVTKLEAALKEKQAAATKAKASARVASEEYAKASQDAKTALRKITDDADKAKLPLLAQVAKVRAELNEAQEALDLAERKLFKAKRQLEELGK